MWWPPRISTSIPVTISPIIRITSRRGRRTALPIAVGAEFHPDLDVDRFEAVFRKGAYDAGYSGFSGHDERGTPLADWLRQRDVDQVDVVGIATDHCVRRTAEDAARQGLATRVLVNLTAGVGEESTAAAIEALRAAGVAIVAGT